MNKEQEQEASVTQTRFWGEGAVGALPQNHGGDDNRIRVNGPRLPRSPLARLQLARPRTSEEMHKLAVEVWRQRGLALIDPLLITDDFARQALINEANRLYGRNAAGGC